MSRPLFEFTVREKLRNPVHLIAWAIGLAVVILPAIISWGDRGAVFASTWQTSYRLTAQLLALLLGTGLIGRDLESGALAGWAVRPLGRVNLYVTRLAGTATALGLLLLAVTAPLPWLSDGAITPAEAAGALLVALLSGLGILSAIALISLFARPYQDVGLLLILALAAPLAKQLFQQHHMRNWAEAIGVLSQVLLPSGAFARVIVASGSFPTHAAALYTLGIGIEVTAGSWLLRRRRLTPTRA